MYPADDNQSALFYVRIPSYDMLKFVYGIGSRIDHSWEKKSLKNGSF